MDGRGRDCYSSVSIHCLGQAYYQKKDFKSARKSIEEAIRRAEEIEEYRPKEQWYVLLAACLYELKEAKVITQQYALEQSSSNL